MRSTLKRTRCAGGYVGNDRRGAELPFDDRGPMREGDAKRSAGDVPVLHDLSEHPVHSCAGYRETQSGAPQVYAGVAPMTAPAASTSGPLLPELIAASVWITRSRGRSRSVGRVRARPATTPRLTDCA